jgi:hypothetical protein
VDAHFTVFMCSDLTLKVDDTLFVVHKAVLLPKSSVLSTMCTSCDTKNVIDLTGKQHHTAKAMKVFLDELYSWKGKSMSRC